MLAGGAVNSPQLLLLSGIGPAAQLREHGIAVAVDLPGVGEGLQDHPYVPVSWFTRGTTDLHQAETPCNTLRWLAGHRGPLTSNVSESGGFVRTSGGLPAPDVQFMVVPAIAANHGLSPPPGVGPDHRADGGARAQPRPADAALGRPALAAGGGRRLLHRAGRPGRHGGRRAGGAGHRVPGAAGPVRGPAVPARPGRPVRRRTSGRRSGPAPRRSTTRSAPARSGRWWTRSCGSAGWPGCGWWTQRDADRAARQHQRADDRARRARRRPDPRPAAAARRPHPPAGAGLPTARSE